MNKTVLITGASKGIGAQIARAFAEKGCRVAINYCKSENSARLLCEEIRQKGGTAEIFKADVSQEQEAALLYENVKRQLGGVDILINNAGIAQQKLFTDITAADFDNMLAVNVRSVFLMCRAALPYMISQKQGRIINLASMWGEVGASCEVHYSASKAAVIGLTKALAKEEAPSGITVNCVSPGAVDTDMLAGFSLQDKAAICDETPVGRLGTPLDIASACLFLASDDAAFITGHVLSVNGGAVI